MGISFQTLDNQGRVEFVLKRMTEQVFNWLVGRRDPKPREDGKGHDWHLQGIATTESLAVAMCRDENYFIGPVPLDVAFPHDSIEWPGHYFPLRNEVPSKDD